jgi:hypothetical protein
MAAGGVLGAGAGHATIATSRLAVASATARTTRWMQLTVVEASSGFLWFIPVSPGARMDLASDAWLDALDDATTPTILSPDVAPSCPVTLGVEQVTRAPFAGSRVPTSSAVAADLASLEPFASALGYTLPSTLESQLGDVFALGLQVVVLQYEGDAASTAATTHTVQIVERDSRAVDVPVSFGSPVGLDGADGGVVAAQATAFVLSGARAGLGLGWLTLDPSTLEWRADGSSTYLASVDSLLAGAAGAEWLTESASPGRLFAPAAVPGLSPLPALLYRYYELAAAYGDSALVPSVCEGRAEALRSETGTVGSLCPRGALATVPGADACDVEGAAGLSPLALACGAGATDAAFALAGLSLDSVWLNRSVGLLPVATAASAAVTESLGPPVSPVLQASSFDVSCPLSPSSSASPSTSTPVAPASSTTTPSSAASTDPGEVVSAAADVAESASGGCDGSSSDSSDSSDDSRSDSGACDGSTSSDDDDSSGGCSGSSTTSSTDSSDCTAHGAARGHHARRGTTTRAIVFTAAAVMLVRRRRRR